MKPLKVAVLGIGALLLLLAVVLGIFIARFDPNDYKDELQKLVREHTGRQLELPGKLSLAVFPRIALEFGPATLGNAPGFGAEPMLAVERVRLGLRLMPLLHRRIEVDTAEFTRPALHLAVDAHGHDNWSDLGGKDQPANAGETATSTQLAIAGLKVVDGSLSYSDLRKGSRIVIGGLKLDTGALNGEQEVYTLAAPVIELTFSGTASPKSGIKARMSFSRLVTDLKAQTLQADDMQVEALGAKLTGTLHGKSIIDAPDFRGAVTLADVSLRELLPQLEIAAPVTSDPAVLKHFGFTAELVATANSLQLGQLKLQLDDSAITGSAGISNLDTMALGFELAINRVNADRYLAPAAPAGAAAAAATTSSPPVAVPVELLRSLNLHGNVAVGEAVFAGIKFTKVRLGVNAAGGKLHLFPSEAQLYGGQYRGDISLDASAALPVASFNEQVTAVDFAPLMKDWFKTSKASGRGNLAVKAQARGKDSDAMLRTLNGSLKVNVDNGAVEGIDLWYEIRRAHALLKKQPIPERTGPARTLFTSLGTSGNIANGVLTTNDISAVTRALRVTGKGVIDLVASRLDITLDAAVQKVTDGGDDMNDVVGFAVPVRVTGALTDPTVRPDLGAIAKAAVQQKLDEKKQELEQQLRDKLQDKLKGLFGN
jgi:AsmA protein